MEEMVAAGGLLRAEEAGSAATLDAAVAAGSEKVGSVAGAEAGKMVGVAVMAKAAVAAKAVATGERCATACP